MAMTLEMLVARVETLEKQYALLIKERDAKTKKEEKEDKEAKKETKKEKKAKKSKDDTSSDDEGKPKKKRGTNGYILFSNANRKCGMPRQRRQTRLIRVITMCAHVIIISQKYQKKIFFFERFL